MQDSPILCTHKETHEEVVTSDHTRYTNQQTVFSEEPQPEMPGLFSLLNIIIRAICLVLLLLAVIIAVRLIIGLGFNPDFNSPSPRD